MSAFTHKRHTQPQLNELWASRSGKTTYEIAWSTWHTPTNHSSLRLSAHGYKFLSKELAIQSYVFELTRTLVNKHLLLLERHFQGTYYLANPRKIMVFDQEDASMLGLLDGDLVSYLEKLELTANS